MSALKRQHGMQQHGRIDKSSHNSSRAPDASLPASKRLKSSHDSTPLKDTFAAILDTNTSSRKKLSAVTTNGIPSKSAAKVDETRANVTADVSEVGHVVVSSSEEDTDSDDEDSDDVGSVDDADEEEQESNQDIAPITNGTHQTNGDTHSKELAVIEDVDMVNGVDGEGEDEEPSFGDMLKARHPDAIDVYAQLPDPHAAPPELEPATGKDALLRPVTGHSLATVLQQALKTNDKDMLESCFHLRDLQAVRNTIQRLPSPLVGSLLSRISERVYKRPGRTGSLMIWIQWCMVAHGGYLAQQPDILRKLKSLNQVMRQRAQGLQPLVQLKAKLDLLTAQIELRRGLQSQRERADAAADDEGVLYIEGDDESGWQSDDKDAPLAIEAPTKAIPEADSDDEEEDFNPVQQDDSAEEDVEENLLDLEAEETDDDGEDDEEEDSDEASASEDDDDLEDGSSEEESEVEVKPARPQTLNRKR